MDDTVISALHSNTRQLCEGPVEQLVVGDWLLDEGYRFVGIVAAVEINGTDVRVTIDGLESLDHSFKTHESVAYARAR